MHIELKNVKHAAFASDDSDCFEASVYIDGKKAGRVSNSGHGGPNHYDSQTLFDRLEAYAKTLPHIDLSKYGENKTMEQSADIVIGDIFSAHLQERNLKRLCAKAVLFRIPGQKYEEGQYHQIKGKYDTKLKAHVLATHGPGVEILNERFA